jgi:hypothetical protein
VDEDEADILYGALNDREKRSFCFRLFNEASEGDSLKVEYASIVSALVRSAVFLQIVNCSFKLSGVLSAWSYYIVIWPYYFLIGVSLIFSCGSLLLLFSWIC